MATLNIGGRDVTVDDSFLKLSPDQQNATVEEIAASLPKAAAAPGFGAKALDVAKQIGSGVVTGTEGAAAGPAVLASLGGKALDYLAPGLSDPEAQKQQAEIKALIDKNRGGGIAQYLPEPQTPLGQSARNATEIVTQLAGNRGNLAHVLPVAVGGGVGSEVLRRAAEGTPFEVPAAIGGLIFGGGGATKIGNVLSARRAEKAVAGVTPTGEQLGEIVDQGYKGLRESGTELAPTAVSKAIGDIRAELHSGSNSIDPSLTPRINTLLGQAEKRYAPAPTLTDAQLVNTVGAVQPAAKAGVQFGELDALRRNLGAIAKDKMANATEAGAASRAQKALDRAIENFAPGDVLKGDAAALAAGAREARGNAAAEFRLTAIDALRQRAADQAKATHSGLNYENALKGQIKSFVRRNNKGFSPAQQAGLNAEEVAALRRSIGGTLGTRSLRYFGKLLGGGGGLGGLAAFEVGNEGGGHGAGGLALGLTSLLAGRAIVGRSNAIARKQAEHLAALIASRSPAAANARLALPPPQEPLPAAQLVSPLALGIPQQQR